MSSKTGANFFRRTDVKLTLWYIFTFLISTLIIYGFLYLRLKHQLIKEVDLLLLDEIKELKEFMVRYPNDLKILRDFEEFEKAKIHYPLYFQILGANRDLLYISENLKGFRNPLSERIWVDA